MHRFLHRHILLPAYETLYHGRNTFRYLAELERSQWLARTELQELQFERLVALITHAYRHCPYYRELWNKNGCRPRDLREPQDFARWPLTTREQIREHRSRMQACGCGIKLLSKSTGGSSGVPLQFDLNPDSNDRRNAASHRGYSWACADLGLKMLYIWGVPLQQRSSSARLKDRAYYWLYRRKIVNSFSMTEKNIPDVLAMHNRYKPDIIVAFTNPLYEFARALEGRGIRPYSPRSIVVGAEKLYPFQRTTIESVFSASVFETYGSREFMLMAAECDRHEGLHLTMESLFIEVLNDDGTPTPAGKEGNVVVTDLFNYGMPFVRYVNGDCAIAGWRQCSCGRGLPLMSPPTGRQLDILHTPDGRVIPGEFFPHLIKDFVAVKRFQVIQDAPDHIIVRLVVELDWSQDQRLVLETIIRDTFGPRMNITIAIVDSIELTKSGKLPVVVNRCPSKQPCHTIVDETVHTANR
jgi:phenylacetate-CoA ligase